MPTLSLAPLRLTAVVPIGLVLLLAAFVTANTLRYTFVPYAKNLVSRVSCEEARREIFAAVKQLESQGVSDSLGFELANTTTRVQDAISFLKRGQDSLDTSNALDLADEEIERAWTEVRYIARLRAEGGRDARYR